MIAIELDRCWAAASSTLPLIWHCSLPPGNPLPAIIHATLTPSQLGAGRMIIVGDVHGCLAELHELLAECEFRAGTDTLIFVGDLVNKGPSSAEVRGRSSCRRQTARSVSCHRWRVDRRLPVRFACICIQQQKPVDRS